MLLWNDLLSSPLNWFFNDAWNVQISSVSFIPVLCASFGISHRCFYVIFMRLKLSIQRERTFYTLHMGTGQQMSIPVIHISCQNWNVSPIHHTSSNKVLRMKYIKRLWKTNLNLVALVKAVSNTLRVMNCLRKCVSTPDFLGVGTKGQMIFTHLRKLEIQQRQVPSGNVNN